MAKLVNWFLPVSENVWVLFGNIFNIINHLMVQYISLQHLRLLCTGMRNLEALLTEDKASLTRTSL